MISVEIYKILSNISPIIVSINNYYLYQRQYRIVYFSLNDSTAQAVPGVMEGTSLPPQPSTPKTLPVETGDIGSISSMTLSEPSSPQITQEGNGPKQRSTTTVNSYELPLQKLTFSETPSDTNMIEGAQLLYGQVASYKPRPREDSAAQATPSRRNAIVRLTPLPLFESPQNEHEEIYNGVAYWYQK